MQGSLITYTYITVQHSYVSYAQQSMFKLSDRNKCEFYLISTGKNNLNCYQHDFISSNENNA